MSLSKVAASSEISGKKAKKRNFIATIDNQLVNDKHDEVANKNSKWGERCAERAFTDYLETIQAEDFAFWDFKAEFLDNLLSKFWFTVRQSELDEETKEPKRYKIQSLKTLRYSLNCFLKEHGKKNITSLLVKNHWVPCCLWWHL